MALDGTAKKTVKTSSNLKSPSSTSDHLQRVKVIYFNAHSLAKDNACDSLSSYCLINGIDVVMISETWLKVEITDSELSLNNQYNVYRNDRKPKPNEEDCRGGGVLILVKKSLRSCIVQCLSNHTEVISVDVYFKDSNARFVCCYLTNGNGGVKRVQVDEIRTIFDYLSDVTPLIAAGDFNLPLIEWENAAITEDRSINSIFVNACLMNGLSQLIDKPTRIVDETRSSILDLLLTTDPDIIEDIRVTSPPFKSDHEAISFEVLAELDNIQSSDAGFNFYKGDYEGIESNLFLVSWPAFFLNCSSVDDMYDHFLSYLHFLISVFIPRRGKNQKHHELRNHIETLSRLMQSEPRISLNEQLQKATKRLRIIEESGLSFKNSKDFFRYTNKRIRGKDGVGALKVDGRLVSEDVDKAEVFREYFASVFLNHNDNVSPVNEFISDCPSLIVTNEGIIAKIKELQAKCSTTPDLVPPIFYKNLAKALAEPLRLILTCD